MLIPYSAQLKQPKLIDVLITISTDHATNFEVHEYALTVKAKSIYYYTQSSAYLKIN